MLVNLTNCGVVDVCKSHLTVGEVAAFFQLSDWKVRRVVDSLDAEIPRAGRYRLVPRELLGVVAVELDRRGWLSKQEPITA